MQKELLDLFTKSIEINMETARKLGELNKHSYEIMLQQQASMLNAFLDATTNSVEAVANAKGAQELVEGQAKIGREFGERGMEILRTGIASANETTNQYNNLIQESANTAQEQLVSIAKSVMKAH